MSEWFYIWLAFGLTWVSVAGYAWRLQSRRAEAERGLQQNGGRS